MARKTMRLLVLAGVLALLPAAHTSALEPYCCVCTACSTGGAVQCVTVAATGTLAAGCATACSDIGCTSSKVVEGECPAPDACASLLGASAPAPALSWQALTVLALALTAWGLYRTQRRLHT
jgi:hypothetical protein